MPEADPPLAWHEMKAIAVIPARFASTRLPGKVLLRKTGKYLVQHTYEQAKKSHELVDVIVATDDRRVVKAVKGFHGKVMLTSRRHNSGTDRIAEVARKVHAPIIVNLQADEPEIAPHVIDFCVRLARLKGVDIATLAAPFHDKKEMGDPSKVKVLINRAGFAVNFSRSVPGQTYFPPLGAEHPGTKPKMPPPKRHVGIYAYKRTVLLRFTRLASTLREKTERLEQLRALERGFRIKVGLIPSAPPGIDTAADYARFVKRHPLRPEIMCRVEREN